MGNLVGKVVLRPKGYVFRACRGLTVAVGAGLKIDVAIELQATILKSNCSFSMTRIHIKSIVLLK